MLGTRRVEEETKLVGSPILFKYLVQTRQLENLSSLFSLPLNELVVGGSASAVS